MFASPLCKRGRSVSERCPPRRSLTSNASPARRWSRTTQCSRSRSSPTATTTTRRCTRQCSRASRGTRRGCKPGCTEGNKRSCKAWWHGMQQQCSLRIRKAAPTSGRCSTAGGQRLAPPHWLPVRLRLRPEALPRWGGRSTKPCYYKHFLLRPTTGNITGNQWNG